MSGYSGRWAAGVVGRREIGYSETGARRRSCRCASSGEPCADCQRRIEAAEERELWDDSPARWEP